MLYVYLLKYVDFRICINLFLSSLCVKPFQTDKDDVVPTFCSILQRLTFLNFVLKKKNIIKQQERK